MSATTIRLTAYASGGGCATKIPQSDLAGILGGLQLDVADARLLVGAGTSDDAAVYRLDGSTALVVTTDFFAPVVDDPGDYGAIAAANALSDVYAMGGTPLLALNLVAWPGEDVLPPWVLTEVLEAGAATVRSAGAVLAGGHSIRDAEPKYGLAVVGTVHPDRVTSIVSNATKLGEAPPDVVRAPSTRCAASIGTQRRSPPAATCGAPPTSPA